MIHPSIATPRMAALCLAMCVCTSAAADEPAAAEAPPLESTALAADNSPDVEAPAAATRATAIQTAEDPSGQRPALQTGPERSGFGEYTSYAEMMQYLEDVRSTSTEMKLASFGTSYEGRELPYAVLSRPTVTQPWEALVSGKPIVVVSANVHGNERTLRESLLILLREMVDRNSQENQWLDDIVILVIPSINPDGFIRGTRGNAWGLDLNRDYMKLEQASLSKLVQNIHHKWHPHVVVDGHNGGSYPYNICYQAGSNAAADPALTQICDKEIFPQIDLDMQRGGYKSFYYARGNRTRWTTGGYDPRISRNYTSLSNSIGILLESPRRQEMQTAIESGLVAYKTILNYVQRNSYRVMESVNRARRQTVQLGDTGGDEVMVQMKYEAENEPVTYEIAEGEGDDRTAVTVSGGQLLKKPVATKTRRRPFAYILPRDAVQAVALLRRHNITVETLKRPLELDVQGYVPREISYQREYNHAAAVNVTVDRVITRRRRFPAGTHVVFTAQMMGRVAVHLLEPETSDNVVHWNAMDAWLPKTALDPPTATTVADDSTGENALGRVAPQSDESAAVAVTPTRQRPRRRGPKVPPIIPIYKLMSPTPLPTKIVAE